MSTEIWKVIKDFPNYEVSTFGNVRNITTGKLRKQNIRNGYNHLTLYNGSIEKTLKVHRLVAITFISNPENKNTVNHKDHNPLNNNVNNLEWSTMAEQNKHKREPSKETKSLIASRKVWRVDKNTNEKLELYQTLKLAAQWILDNKFSSSENIDHLRKKIISVAQGKSQTAFGYKWIYEQIETLENEIWKLIPASLINNNKDYFISTLGRVKNPRGRISSGVIESNGYVRIHIGAKDKYYLHRLVAQVFLENPENKTIVNHKDGNKSNSKLDNLEWVTPSENNHHAVKEGLVKHLRSVIQYDLKMKKLNEFSSAAEAEKQLNLNRNSIGMCCRGEIRSTGGFVFRFKDDNSKLKEIVYKNHKSVIQYDLQMNKLNEFSTIAEAGRQLNIDNTSIVKCCKGQQNTAGGFIFKYMN